MTGLDLRLPPEEEAVVEEMRRLAKERFAPRAAGYDASGEFPWDNWRALGAGGFTGMTLPVEVGGAGTSFLAYARCVEEAAVACATTAVIFEVHNSLHLEPLFRFGTKEQHQRFLPTLVTGERLGAFCLTEPTSGSDAAALRTVARRTDSGYALTGQKAFITNGGVADSYVVFARTDPDRKGRSVSAFVVNRDTPGMSFGAPEEKLGLRASHTTAVYFDGAEVDAGCRLGEEGDGMRVALSTLDAGRIGIAAQAVGIASAALSAATAYALERRQFGQEIGRFEGVQWLLAEMSCDLEASRLLLYRAAVLHGQGVRATAEIAQAKLHASTMANTHVPRVLRVLGGYGYLKDFPLERMLRDAKVTEIYEGTSEVMKLLIASALLGPRAEPAESAG